MTKILKFLSGKKSAIASVIGLVVAYMAAKSILGEGEVILIMGLTGIIFGGASYVTGKLVYNKE